MLAPRSGVSVAVALATLGCSGAVLRGGQNATQEPGADPCQCKSWYDVYAASKICGMSNEYFFASGIHQPAPEHSMLLSATWNKYCQEFFKKIKDNVCVNINIGAEYGQWCYVDHGCTEVNGASGTGLVTGSRQLKWKKCVRGSDRMLADFSVSDLADFSRRHDVPFYMADHFAWPMFFQRLWGDVSGYFLPGGDNISIGWEVREELHAIVASGRPVTFDTEKTFNPPHTVVEGKAFFSVVDNDQADGASGGSWNKVYNVAGAELQYVLRRLL